MGWNGFSYKSKIMAAKLLSKAKQENTTTHQKLSAPDNWPTDQIFLPSFLHFVTAEQSLQHTVSTGDKGWALRGESNGTHNMFLISLIYASLSHLSSLILPVTWKSISVCYTLRRLTMRTSHFVQRPFPFRFLLRLPVYVLLDISEERLHYKMSTVQVPVPRQDHLK